MAYEKIIFVCTGNTCRSPIAEALYKSMTAPEMTPAISRGTVVLFPEPVNPKAEMVLANHNLSLMHHSSCQLTQDDLSDATLVLTMTEKQKALILESYPGDYDCFAIKEFNGEFGDVVDPYGGTLLDYEECYNELARLIRKTVYRLDDEASNKDQNTETEN